MENQEVFLRQLKEVFWENGISLEASQLERLSTFASLVTEKNEEVNLISRKDIENIVENHIFISALMTKYIPKGCRKFLDIGTGGGFPGIPLAIMNPMMRGVLVDSTAKKIAAVEDFIYKMKLSNVKAENFRVEDEEFKKKYADTFDLIVSRATVPLIILFRYSLPLIKEKAYIVSVKGGDLQDEMKTAEMKYRAHIRKSTIFDLSYKPNNTRNEKGKKLIIIELMK